MVSAWWRLCLALAFTLKHPWECFGEGGACRILIFAYWSPFEIENWDAGGFGTSAINFHFEKQEVGFFWHTLVLYFCWVDDNAIFDVNKWSNIYNLHDITEIGLQSLGTMYVCSSSCYKILGFPVSLVRNSLLSECWAHNLFLLSRQKWYNVVCKMHSSRNANTLKQQKKKELRLGEEVQGFKGWYSNSAFWFKHAFPYFGFKHLLDFLDSAFVHVTKVQASKLLLPF